MLFKAFSTSVFKRCMAAILATVLLLTLAACVDSENPPSGDTSKPTDSSQSSSPSDTSSEETASKEYNLDGEYTVSDNIVAARDDANEVIYSGNCANLSNPLKGLADSQAENLRQQILNTKNTESYYKITGTKYYISPNGKDTNDGKSESTPFRTVQAISGIYLKEGDAILFERGSVFRIANTISTKSGVIYGSYGKGNKPKIYAAPIPLADSTVWTPTKTKNVWKVSYPYKEAGSIVFDHGKIVGYKKRKLKELAKDYDFYHDHGDGILYLRYSGGNPAKDFKSIEASTSIFVFTVPNMAHDIIIDNICIKYSAYMGIHATNAKNITVTNCEMGYIGGKDYSPTNRFGNAIEAWSGADGFNISNNWIYQTFDTAITWQGTGGKVYQNINVKNNLLEYNNADIEFWESEQHIFKDVSIDGNIMRFNALGWGTRVDDGGIRGIEGPIVGTSVYVTGSNIAVTNNIIDSPAMVIVKWDFKPYFKSAIRTSGNKIFVKNSYRTTDVVIRNSQISNYNAKNLGELKAAFSAFDPSAELYWEN